MVRHAAYSRQRAAQVAERIHALVWAERVVPQIEVAGPVDRIPYAEARRLEYRPAEAGLRLGPLWATYWFRISAPVPDGWERADLLRVDLLWDSASEATLWLDGQPAQGLNPFRQDAPLVVRDGRVECEVEVACNGLFGAEDEQRFELRRCELARFDPGAWRLWHDLETLRALEADREHGLDESWAGELLATLDRFCTAWETGDPDAAAILAPLYERRNASRTHELAAIGHGHLDTAWLWPLAESRRKIVRTISTQLRLCDAYPEHRFAFSQAQQHAWIRDEHPELWERVKEQVAARRIVPVGASWVEPDCILPSGEALVRQLLLGRRFFEREYGVRCREFWSPDAFGYCNQLPQLLRGAGLTRFLTQKLSWSRYTKPEHHTLRWEGLDGSSVLTHFPPLDTYNSVATIPELRRSARQYLDHDRSGTSLLVFGHGDGGGGPTPAMLETLRRARDLQGVPRTELRGSDEFFAALEADAGRLETVVGELYLEYHRGTYTSQAAVKRGNRRSEELLHDVEFLAAVAGDYPRAELERLWQLLCLNQFHDILPGSSIAEVYEDAARDHAEIERAGTQLRDAALARLVEPGEGWTPVNTLGFTRAEVAEAPDGLRFVRAEPYGIGETAEPADRVTADGLVLENACLRAELAPDGTLVSLRHKPSGRETLAAPGNRLELYDDRPVAFDAWDVDPFHLDACRDLPPAESWSPGSESPLRAELVFERPGLRQVVRLDAGAHRLEFHVEVDWQERATMLKVCFPLAVHAHAATYETQFGYAERPTHRSTRREQAQYEVPGLRFADLSEHGFGAALLSESKYGWSCEGNELRLSLLRAPGSPDPDADRGRHRFAYALCPHAGGWREAGVVAEAARFNVPLRWARGHAEPRSFARVDDPNLVLDTVKRAEGSEALVLRLYEAHGARGTARVELAPPFSRARLATILEEPGEELRVDGGAIELPYAPHRVLTVVCE